jgi:hypothetical protein
MTKETLDRLLEEHKAQPVGNGYIDIIVKRENYKLFVTDLVRNGYNIMCMSWWEWCPGEKKSDFGLGGPKSRYYEGWFSELIIDLDEFEIGARNKEREEVIREVISAIETKLISFPTETVTFKQSAWLTPALWLDVPEDWRNE